MPAALSEYLFEEHKAMDYHSFSWVNKWIMYFPMFTSITVNNCKITKRNTLMHYIVFPCIVIICISCPMWRGFYHMYYVDGSSLYKALYLIGIFCLSACRLLSLYYFFYQFQYYTPSEHTSDNYDIEMECPSTVSRCFSMNLPQHRKRVRQTSIRIKMILFWIVLSSVIRCICHIIASVNHASDTHWHTILQVVYGFIGVYFYNIPLWLSQFILSILYCEQCIFLEGFCHVIDQSSNIDFATAIHDYSSFKTQFDDRKRVLETMIKFRMVTMIAWLWIDLPILLVTQTWIQTFNTALWIINDALPFFELVVAGNAVTVQFNILKNKIYSLGCQRDFLTHLSIKQTQYLFLLEYVPNFPLVVNMFGKEVSFENALKVITAFAVAKSMSYLFIQIDVIVPRDVEIGLFV
eukprot:32212_1